MAGAVGPLSTRCQLTTGSSARANAAAQSYIELNTFSHVVQLQSPMQITWLRGGKQHLDQLTAIPGLCRVNIKDDDCAVELTGQHQGVMAGLR